MIPNNESLLLCLRRTLTGLLPAMSSEEHRAVLQSMDLYLNELLLRNDPQFYLEHFRQGRQLVSQGIGLGLAGDDILEGLPELQADQLNGQVEELMLALQTLTAAAGAPVDGPVFDYLNRVSDWELRFYQHRLNQAGGTEEQKAEGNLSQSALQVYLREKFPDLGEIQVTAFERLYGGFSKATVMFATDRPIKGCQEFVIRAEQSGTIIVLEGGTVDMEFPVVSMTYENGVTVPEPLWVELDSCKLGTRFFVSRRARGKNLGTAVGAGVELEKSVLHDLVQELVRIHAIELDPNDDRVKNSHLSRWMNFETLEDYTLAYSGYWTQVLEDYPHSASPLIQRGLNWVRENIPDCSGDVPSFTHGDYGLHNLLIDDGKVTAILDWEISRVGDRAEDFSWFIHCMEGTATAEELLALYYELGGKPISAERLHFYDVYRCVQMIIICNIALAKLHRMGDNIGLGVIGFQMFPAFANKLKRLIG